MMTISEEKQQLFDLCRKKLGAPIRKVELTDDQLCAYLEIAMGDYSSAIQNYIIEANWASFYGKTNLSKMSNQDWAWALSVRTFDMAKEYSYYFSKEVGLQQRGPWELKKDFFEIEEGRQVYSIPANREINKVLYFTNSTTDTALLSNYGGLTADFGGGAMGQLGLGGGALFAGMGSTGFGGMYALPLYDIALTAADMKEKNKYLGCDLVYKVTAGPNGTHLIHLESVPGGRFEKMGGFGRKHPLFCWYTYYDTSNLDDECIADLKNNGDILLSPDQVPLSKMEYSYLNDAAKQIVRQLFIGEAAESLGFVRGKFSGNINMISSPVTMDYNMMITYGQKEKDAAKQMLNERLQRLSPYQILEQAANTVEQMLRIKKGTPLGIYLK